MKKQILFLTFFISAVIAGMTKAHAQLGPSSSSVPSLTCTGNANFLHPVAGVDYKYEMDGNVTGAGETVDNWTWFATKNPAFISTGALNTADMLNVTTGELTDATSGVYGVSSTTNSVTIKWSPEIIAATKYQGNADSWATASASNPTPTFVIGYGEGACSNNIQVYEINPILNFTLDVANVGEAWGDPTSSCVDEVASAKYNSTSHAIDMDYGSDTLYFEIGAANFVTYWTPTIRFISGLQGVQSAAITLHSSLADAQTASSAGLASTTWDGTANYDWTPQASSSDIQLSATTPADAVTGVSAYLRVIITNSTYESLSDNPFTIAVDAIDGSGTWDMEDDDCTTASNASDQVDEVTHTVLPRPTIHDANTPDSNTADPNYKITKTGE